MEPESERQIKEAFQESFKDRLERLGLVMINQRRDKKTGDLMMNRATGKPTGSKWLTPLGRLLLEQMGLLDKGDSTSSPGN
ncbi:hypothetical protein QKW35_05625 [Pontibacterium granulatum]|uniref:hypothetical protein n=1 Tax=Pontibacterium granulatum TaxID=2036029 RepID=UPI00249A66DE|nr:hypothetical protein [Pontibacterium granulatum]MDI3323847.1 hypothetical protein [Pontibacterium granulatum]